jgi:DNA polymerase-3 subunit epsilon
MTSRGKAKESMNDLAGTFDLCPKLLGLEKSKGACFWYQLKKCRGACIGKEDADIYNNRLLLAFDRQRIKQWPYKHAVLVQEKSAHFEENDYGIVVDKWCVIAEISRQPDCEPVVTQRGTLFDLDTYKILHRYLNAKISGLIIRPLNQNQLIELGI